MQVQELPPGHTLDCAEPPHRLILEQQRAVGATKRPDHTSQNNISKVLCQTSQQRASASHRVPCLRFSMPAIYDGIILGAGHNALVLQAYLARSGLRVLSLDRAPLAGGGLATEQHPGHP